jgi:ribosomal protein S12 methylthiotransferase accessory factor
MVASSLGEVIERALGSFMGFAHDTLIHYGTYDTLVARGYKCFPPDELPLFVESQYKEAKFPYKPFTRDTFVGWVKGAKLLDGEDVWLPAQIVLPFYLSHPEEPLICYATSGGLAAHISRERAIEHGLAEVFERDAVNLHWNCGHAPRPIVLDCEPRDPRLRRVFDNARSLKTDVRLYLHETDIPGLHTVTAVGFIAGFNKFAYVAGGGGGLSIDAAILGALGEYSQAESANRIVLCAPQWKYSDRVDELLGVDEETPVEDFDIFYKVIGHYGYPKNAAKLKWYLDGSAPIRLSELYARQRRSGSSYDTMLDICRETKLTPIFFDFTLPNMKVVKLTKVFCPELTPPYLHSTPTYGANRYFELPRMLGWTDRVLGPEDLTVSPQPYP